MQRLILIDGTKCLFGDAKEAIRNNKFNYMMLSRLQMDMNYYLNRDTPAYKIEKHLWAGNLKDQIKEMKRLFDVIPIKPDWITLNEIKQYEKEA